MKRIRVMHVIDSLRTGGAERVVATTVGLLDTMRFEVSVCCFSDGLLADEISRKNITVHKLPLNKWVLPVFLFRLAALMRRRKIDIVHTHLFTADVLGRIAARMAGVKTVYCTLHTSYRFKSKRDLASKLRLCADSITGNWLCDRFIAVSELVREYHLTTQGIPLRKTSVLGNPIDIETFSPPPTFDPYRKRNELGIHHEASIVINVANLTEVKGQRFLLMALAETVKTLPGTVLLIAGEGPLRQELTGLRRSLGLDRHVHFLGRRNDVAELLASSDVFVLSSLNEGISIALLEAMALGKPVVATNVGSNPEVVQDGVQGFLVPSEDPKALAAAIIETLRNSDAAKRFSTAARAAVSSKYEARVITAELQEMYLDSADKAKT